MGACSNMTTEKIYPRSCFACGGPMMKSAPGSTTLICRLCEVTESGTVSGRWKNTAPDRVEFGEVVIRFVDHGSTLEYPSPDSLGYRRTR
jgi:hypothetical protein